MNLVDSTKQAFEFAHAAGILKPHGDQVTFALRIAAAIEAGNAAYDTAGMGVQQLAEAGTGTGKTLGYLIPVLLDVVRTGRRAIISTYTLHLQRQMLGEGKPNGDMDIALDIVSKFTKTPRLTVARRIGMRNFISRVRAENFLAEKRREHGPQSAPEIAEFVDWVKAGGGTFEEWKERYGDLPDGLSQEDVCLTSHCDKKDREAYDAHAQDAVTADVVIVTHAMLMRAALHNFKLLHDADSGNAPVGNLVADEADRLESAAEAATSYLFALREFSALSKKIAGTSTTPASQAAERLAAMMAEYCPFEEGSEPRETIVLFSHLRPHERTDLMHGLAEMLKASNTQYGACTQALKNNGMDTETTDLYEGFIEHVDHAREILEALGGADESKTDKIVSLRWSPVRAYPSFKMFNINPARVLKRVWSAYQQFNDQNQPTGVVESKSKVINLIAASATLTAPGASPSFVDIKVALGFFSGLKKDDPKYDEHHFSIEPRTFGRASFVFPDPSLPAPTMKNDQKTPAEDDYEDVLSYASHPEWLDYISLMCKTAAGEGGRTLCQVTSFRDTQEIAKRLRDMGVAPVVEHIRGNRLSDHLGAFLASDNAVLISPAAWEGVDLPGKLSHVIAARIPFTSQNQGLELALAAHLRQRGIKEDAIKNILFVRNRNRALRILKQGFGRGIRAHSDCFTFWVGDPRFPPAPIYSRDGSGMVPAPSGHDTYSEAHHSIPVRFRDGLGAPFTFSARMLLKDGSMLTADMVR